MESLKEFKKNIENIEINYNYEEVYNDLYNAVIDYMNESQDYDFEYLFDDFIDYDMAEERAKYELENGGLVRLYYFLGNANCNNDIFKIDGYGNLQDATFEDLEDLKNEILNMIDEKLMEKVNQIVNNDNKEV